jgi:hypothetical protein
MVDRGDSLGWLLAAENGMATEVEIDKGAEEEEDTEEEETMLEEEAGDEDEEVRDETEEDDGADT